jgi:hypothetical protein
MVTVLKALIESYYHSAPCGEWTREIDLKDLTLSPDMAFLVCATIGPEASTIMNVQSK